MQTAHPHLCVSVCPAVCASPLPGSLPGRQGQGRGGSHGGLSIEALSCKCPGGQDATKHQATVSSSGAWQAEGIPGHGETWRTWKGEPGGASWWQEAKSEKQTSVNARRLSGRGAHMGGAHILLSPLTIFLPPTVVTSEQEKKRPCRDHTGLWHHQAAFGSLQAWGLLLSGQRTGASLGTDVFVFTVRVQGSRLDVGFMVKLCLAHRDDSAFVSSHFLLGHERSRL